MTHSFAETIEVLGLGSSLSCLTPVNITIGNAATECLQLVGEGYLSFKLDFAQSWIGSDGLVSISSEDGDYVDFSAVNGYKVYGAFVKAGSGDVNGLFYDYRSDGVSGDTGLWAPENKGISHVTLCYKEY
jgi:hypothetical protein